jgi:hypothetical protein
MVKVQCRISLESLRWVLSEVGGLGPSLDTQHRQLETTDVEGRQARPARLHLQPTEEQTSKVSLDGSAGQDGRHSSHAISRTQIGRRHDQQLQRGQY